MATNIKSTGFDRSQIEEIKQRISIEDVISRYVRLKPSGKNLFGLCPFHKEDTPSFSVNPELQIFKCFGCGEGGDVFSFIQKIENIEFYEALQQLADEAGIKLKTEQRDPEKAKKYLKIQEAHRLASDFYHNILKNQKEGQEARAYLKNRQISKKAIDEFKLGYSPSSKSTKLLLDFLKKNGFSGDSIVEYGLAVKKDGKIRDKFINRIMFPIFDKRGKIIAFSGRAIEKDPERPKYLNSPETLIFLKRRNLFGFYQGKQSIRKHGYTILVEGQTDVISSWQVGVKNIVAPLGTGLTDEQLELIKKISPEIILAFDTDRAGLMAIMRAAKQALSKGMTVFASKIKYGKDADECIRKDKNLWYETIEDRVPVITFFLDIIIDKYDPKTLDGKKTIISKISSLMRVISDPVIKDHHIKEISTLTGINQDILRETFSGEETEIIEKTESEINHYKSQLNTEIYLLTMIIQYPDQLKSKINKIELKYIQDKQIREALKRIISQIEKSGKIKMNSIKKGLDENTTGILEDSAMRPLWVENPNISELSDEFEDTITKIEISYLKNEISNLKNKLSLSEQQGKTKESNEILNTINTLIERLDKLTRQ